MLHRDEYLIIHDGAILGLALTLAVVSAATTGSAYMFAATFFSVAFVGVSLMKFPPTRRRINDSANVLSRKSS